LLWVFGALAVFAAGALLFAVERRLRARTARVVADRIASDPDAERVFDETRMRHRGTGFADQMPLLTALEAPGEMTVFCTAEAVFAGRLIIPMSSVEDAAIAAGALRIRWRRGGETLQTVLEARMHEMERLRREIHLRQKNVVEKLMAMVQK